MLLDGFAKQHPSIPRLPPIIWNIEVVLYHLARYPPNHLLSYKLLCKKTLTLLLLATTRQRADVMSMSVAHRYLWEGPDHVIAYLGRFSKTFNKRNKSVQQLTIYTYPMDPDLCPVAMLKYYMAVSEQYRRKQGNYVNSLFVTSLGTPASRDTCARWVREVLTESGIDPSIYKPHSVHSASACHNLEKGYPLEQVLAQGAWASEHTFMVHYRWNFKFESLGDIEVMSTCSLPGSPPPPAKHPLGNPRQKLASKYSQLKYKKAVTKHLVQKFHHSRANKIIASKAKTNNKQKVVRTRFSTFGAVNSINSH